MLNYASNQKETTVVDGIPSPVNGKKKVQSRRCRLWLLYCDSILFQYKHLYNNKYTDLPTPYVVVVNQRLTPPTNTLVNQYIH